jgi:GNAT superfamily N-acetyltransferase
MAVRLVMPEDKGAVLSLAEMQVVETLPHLAFDAELAGAAFDEVLKGDGQIGWVAQGASGINGFLWAKLCGYAFASGVFVQQEVLYVRPDKRGTRAAVELLLEYIRWGEIVGANETLFGISNGHKPERAARLFERLGAERVGYHHRIVNG